MPTVAYLANQFPSPVEPYVAQEIQELRRRAVIVIPCSARPCETGLDPSLHLFSSETLYLQPLQLMLLIQAVCMCLIKFSCLKEFFRRALLQGNEPLGRRLRALLHTWLGVYYALLLGRSGAEHIHVHHGYFGSWIAMVAARFLGIEFSMTLHGSDLLLHPAYLDTKLEQCKFCVTISEFNKKHILEQYPEIQADKIIMRRMGVDIVECPSPQVPVEPRLFSLLAVGRLHRVKDHAFLIRACQSLKNRDIRFECVIAGEGPERASIEQLIIDLGLQSNIRLPGHLSSQRLDQCYAAADVVVLTSRSEGIPLVLMEAMARGRPVLAPAITGVPELVLHGKNGFLYQPGSLEDFVAQVESIHHSRSPLRSLGKSARKHVLQHFNREKNLAAFCDLLLTQVNLGQISPVERRPHESSVLQ
jgi:colanic acid/amylovoran biosynthesis glycosyltransferase